MSSEIKVDTISEQTSANGVAIDSVIVKDGAIDVQGVSDGIIIDADGDTTISADTDDQIDFKVGGNDTHVFDANGHITLKQFLDATTAGGRITGASNRGNVARVNLYQTAGSSDGGEIRLETANSSNTMTERMRLTSDGGVRTSNIGKLATGAEDAPDCTEGGITLDQNAQDDKILTLKSSDVAHGVTDDYETDTYAQFKKYNAAQGGLRIEAVTEGSIALMPRAVYTTGDTGKGTGATAPIFTDARKKSGTGLADPASNENIFAVTAGFATKFIVDAEGELHSDGGAQTAYDTYEDAHLVRAYDLSHGRGVIDSKFDKFISYNHEKLADMKLVGREPDGTPNHFINVTGMQRLHNGAILQQYEKHEKLANAMYELAKAAVGEDKANEILEQNDIKLLK